MSESTQTKLLSSVPAISSLAEGDKITVVTASGQTALVSLSNLQSIMRAGMSAGRNLVKDSAYVEVNPSKASHVIQTTDNLRPGDVITLSADEIVITGNNSDIHNNVYIDIEDAASGSWITLVELPRTKRDKATFTLPTKSFTYDRVQVRICAKIYGVSGPLTDTVKIYGLSVVRGAVAPLRWTPAPEDLNWGGVISSFSEASKASTRISKKGGQHEYIDNTDEGSHRISTDTDAPQCTCVSREMRGHQQLPASGILVHVDRRSELSGIPALWNTDGVSFVVICSPSLLANRSEADIFKNCGGSFEPRWIQSLGYDKSNVALALGKEVAA